MNGVPLHEMTNSMTMELILRLRGLSEMSGEQRELALLLFVRGFIAVLNGVGGVPLLDVYRAMIDTGVDGMSGLMDPAAVAERLLEMVKMRSPHRILETQRRQ